MSRGPAKGQTQRIAQRGEQLEALLDVVFDKAEQRSSVSPVVCGQTLYATFVHDVGLEGHALGAAIEERPFEEMVANSLMERWVERGLGCE